MDYLSHYTRLCESRSQSKSSYCRFSGLHQHHIVPLHSGGNDDKENLTYLTVREHILAHRLLWKIYKNPNDLRAMYMLGARLTPEERRITGLWCAENRIGIHGWDKGKKSSVSREQYEKALVEGVTNAFMYWASEEGRKERASLGGKSSWAARVERNEQFSGWYHSDPEVRKENASIAGRQSGKKPATNGTETKKFLTEEDREQFIANNPDWRKGRHWVTRTSANLVS